MQEHCPALLLTLTLVACQSSAPAGRPAPDPWSEPSRASSAIEAKVRVSPDADERPNLADVEEALAEGDLEKAHAALTGILCRRYLETARDRLAREELDDGLDALDRALEMMPRNEEARAMRRDAAEQFFAKLIERADALIASGNPADALAVVDRALELRPEDPNALLRRGEGFFALGTQVQDASFIEDSLSAFRAASARSDGADPWLGASRAAYQLSRTDEALGFAREGRERLADVPSIDELKVVAQGVFGAFRARHAEAPDDDATHALFRETEDALNWMIGSSPQDPWAWRELSNLYMWRAEPNYARDVLERGVRYSPADAALHERLSAVTFDTGGNEALLAYYAAFVTRHPSISLGHWYAGIARFELSLAELLTLAELLSQPEERDAALAKARALVQDFDGAEASLRNARELDSTIEESCIAYEIIVRNACGWAHYYAGDLNESRASFLSMEDLKPGGLTWQLEDKLLSGTKSLEFVASAYFAAQQDTALSDREKALAMEQGAKIYDYLHAYDPDVVSWANDAGFMNRDVAVMLAQAARGIEFELQQREDLEQETRDRQSEEARKMLDKAKELMQRSFLAYVDASTLAPEDVRIVNDTGLIVTYYLQRDLDIAQRYLERAVELGEEQVQSTDLSEDARYELENALGDAYQNLGVLFLTLVGDAGVARGWFEKSVAIGPDPRPIIQQYLLQCDAAEAGELSLPLVRDETRWDAPIVAQ